MDELLNNNVIDHNLIYQSLPLNKKKTKECNFFSLNIAQISHYRTMTAFNKTFSYLKRPTDRSVSRIMLNKLFDNMGGIIQRYQLDEINVEEGSKQLITDVKIKDELSDLLDNRLTIHYVFLRKFIPRNKTKTDNIFRKRFEKCGFRYFDIVFKEETLSEYTNRIRKVMSVFQEMTKETQNCIICFQEINPILDFIHIIQTEFKDFTIEDPIFMNNKNQEKIFCKSFNVVLCRNIQSYLKIEKKKADHICHMFSSMGKSNEKNEFQNNKYYISIPRSSITIVFYNVHGNLNSNKAMIQQFKQNVLKLDSHINFFIIGDLNFKLMNEYYIHFTKLLEENDIDYNLSRIPNSLGVYEGYIHRINI